MDRDKVGHDVNWDTAQQDVVRGISWQDFDMECQDLCLGWVRYDMCLNGNMVWQAVDRDLTEHEVALYMNLQDMNWKTGRQVVDLGMSLQDPYWEVVHQDVHPDWVRYDMCLDDYMVWQAADRDMIGLVVG